MGRFYICPKTGLKRGAWTPEEDSLLAAYVKRYGHCNWRELPKYAGLSRCGKSCRLRWLNYLRPSIKRGGYSHEEDELIIKLHAKLGNKWSVIAASLPGRTDNEIKNHWHCQLKKCTTQNATTSEADSGIPILPSMGSSNLLPLESPISSEANLEFDSNFWSEPFEMDGFYLPGEIPFVFSPSLDYETISGVNLVTPPFETSTSVPFSPPNSSDSPSLSIENLLSSKPTSEFDADFWSELFRMDDMFTQGQPPEVSLPFCT